MAIKPILFNKQISTEMVRAILDGRKSCTRRLVKPQPDEKHTFPLGFVTDSTEKKEVGCFGFGINEYGGSIQYAKPPYQPGDILYVRETWKKAPNGYYYYEDWQRNDIADVTKWHPSIHMPKEAARIWLKVTDVRVERLQDMDKMDAVKEGIDTRLCINLNHALAKFKKLWNSTIKKSDLDRYGWDANPYVWVIEFERCEKPEGV
nr:MAG TPA: ASCH domain protein [Caudoviricetes sp.]